VTAPANALDRSVRRPPAVNRRHEFARWIPVGAFAVLVGALTAVSVRYAPLPPLLLVMVPLGLAVAYLVFASPVLAAVLLGASIVEVQDVTGGHLGLHVAASDVLLVLLTARIAADVFAPRRLPVLRALRPVALAVLQYAWLILILLVLHLSFGSAGKSAQRIELFAFPLLVGAYIALRGTHMTVLRAYVFAATVLAVAWPVLNPIGILGSQFDKNPVGGFIASAILLILATRDLRRLLWCLPVLLVGLGLSASRGAILGLVVGIGAIALMNAGGARRAVIAKALAIVAVSAVIVVFLPSGTTARLTNFSASGASSGSGAIYYRNQFYHDASVVIAAHPWIGIGVGNYRAGSAANLTLTTDPHNVFLLEAAEGGYAFAGSFVVLIFGAAFAITRLRRVELAPAAAGILLATAAHGLVDVYWVRGTPVLGWLLVGMACGLAARTTA